MSSRQPFLLDSDVFIAAKNSYYAFAICPGFWASLIYHHGQGTVCSIDRVKSELLAGRPTVLWALAMQRLDEQQRRELESLAASTEDEEQRILRAAELYDRAEVCQQATALVAKHHQRAKDSADGIDNEPLRELLHFLCDAILDRRPLSVSEEKKSEVADSGAGS